MNQETDTSSERLRSRIRKTMAIAAGFLLALTGLAPPATAQLRAESPPAFVPVRDVDLVAVRWDGPPSLVLSTPEGAFRPVAGTYRSGDGSGLAVSKYGQIVALSDPETARRFLVAEIEKMSPRYDGPPQLLFRDDRGRKSRLPGGRFVSADGVTIAVKDGAIVGYGRSR